MDKNDLERRLEAAEKQNLGLMDEIQNLKAQLAEMQDEPEIPDFPTFKGSEPYFFCDAKLEVRGISFPDSETNHVHMDFNAFRTSEYAQEFANKCKLIAMMLHCKWYICCNHHSDFNNGDIQKWTVVFNYNEGKFTVEFSRMREWSTIYFDTEENAQKCAEWLNKHWKEE